MTGPVGPGRREFELAAQSGLPFVFLDAQAVDPEAVALLPPEWALAYRILPLSVQGGTLVVAVSSPARTPALRELAHRTGLKVELALAPAQRIRDVIREVYLPDPTVPPLLRLDLDGCLTRAWSEGATRFGVSLRNRKGVAWWEAGGTLSRVRLAAGWERDLERRLSPGLSSSPVSSGGLSEWDAALQLPRPDGLEEVRVRRLIAPGGWEISLQPVDALEAERASGVTLSPGLLAEVRLLAGRGLARFTVEIDPALGADTLLPALPESLLHPWVRSAHLRWGDEPQKAEASPSSGPLIVSIPEEEDALRLFLRQVRDFRLEAATATFPEEGFRNLADLTAVAPAFFLCVPPGRSGDSDAFLQAGLSWHLHLWKEEGGRLGGDLIARFPPSPNLTPQSSENGAD